MRRILYSTLYLCAIFVLLTSQSGTPLGLETKGVPCYRLNPQHTGQSPYDTTHTNGDVLWSYTTPNGNIYSHPVITTEGNLLFFSSDGWLYSINKNGQQNWQYFTGSGSELCGPAIGDDGTIYCGGSNNTFYALNSNGTLKWSYSVNLTLATTFLAPILDENNILYTVSISDHLLYALDSNGSFLWSHNIGNLPKIPFPPVLSNNGVIYASGGDGLFAFSPNGTQLWNIYLGFYGGKQVSISSSGNIYLTAGNFHLYSIYPNGTIAWSYIIHDLANGSPAISDDGLVYTVAQDYGRIYISNLDGSNLINWTINDYILSPITISKEGTLYFSSRDYWGNCTIHALNQDGTVKWEYQVDGIRLTSSPAVIGEDGTVYITIEDTMYAFSNEDSNSLIPLVVTCIFVMTVVYFIIFHVIRKMKKEI